MSAHVDIEQVSVTLLHLLKNSKRRLIYDSWHKQETHDVSCENAASAIGFLPAFVGAGDAVWREATGKPLGVVIVSDPAALLGYRLADIKGPSFATVMLSTMEAIAQFAQPDLLVLNNLGDVWIAAELRMKAVQAASKPPAS